MWKLRTGILVICGALGLGLSSVAWAHGGGESNPGELWIDGTGSLGGSEGATDPHLACHDFNLRQSDLAGSGEFTIVGTSGSGAEKVDYSGSLSSGGNTKPSEGEHGAVINVAKLISTAQVNGETADAQGFRFKLESARDPQEQRTFTVDCQPCPSGDGSSGGTTTPGASGTPAADTTQSTGAVNTPAVTTASAGPVKTSIGAVTARRARHPAHKRHHKLVRPARHRKTQRRHVKAVAIVAPQLTG